MWSPSDFSSDSGMMTSVWGPALWHTLHTISFNYPDRPDRATRKRYRRFMRSLRHVLPCLYCRENYSDNVRAAGYSDRVFESRDAFSRYIFRLHNHVNTMLGKPEARSYDRVRDKYENFRSRCLENPHSAECAQAAAAPAAAETAPREKGCTEPLYGKKSKCLIRIVPKESPHRTFAMDAQCRVRRRGRGGHPPAAAAAAAHRTSDHTPGSTSTR